MKQAGELDGVKGFFVWDDEDPNKAGVFVTYSTGGADKSLKGIKPSPRPRLYQIYWSDKREKAQWRKSTMRFPLPKGHKIAKAIRTVSLPDLELLPDLISAIEKLYTAESRKAVPADKDVDDFLDKVGI